MADVTFEEEVQAWAAFCKRDGNGALPPLRSEVEAHMRQRYTRAIDGQPISQEELDLIFDYTCDTCELYIKSELLGRQGWDLKTSEAFLTGKHPTMNKIRYCSETITTSILNLRFETQFDSLSRPKSSGVPNFAHLTTTNLNNPLFTNVGQSLSTSSLPSFIPSLAPSGSTLSLHSSPIHSTPASLQHATAPNGNISRSISTDHSLLISSSAPPAGPAHPHTPSPSAPNAAPTQNNRVQELASGHLSSQSSPSLIKPPPASGTPIHVNVSDPNLSRAHSSPTPSAIAAKDGHRALEPSRANSDNIQHQSHTRGATSVPVMSTGTAVKLSPSRSDLVDGVQLKKQPCAKLPVVGFCSPRDCEKSHSASVTMCKWLTMNGLCEEKNCAFQHPNLVTREITMKPIREGTHTQRALSMAEWNTLKLTMVFYCPIPMKPKKCGKGIDCIVVNCPKQHKKPPRTSVALVGSSSTSMVASSSSSSSAIAKTLTHSHSHSHSHSSSSAPGSTTSHSKGAATSKSGGIIVTTASGDGHHAPPHGLVPSKSVPPPLPPKPTLTLKDVTKQQNHINLVLSIMQGGCVNSKPLKILKLEEIHNSALDDQYQAYFRKTQEAKMLRPSEIYAFHGAPTSAITSIAANGFDMSKIKRTKFGHGLYCALDPNVSVEYCGDSSKMLLVRLITDGLKWVKDPAYYVVHESASMNPLYIITFDRS